MFQLAHCGFSWVLSPARDTSQMSWLYTAELTDCTGCNLSARLKRQTLSWGATIICQFNSKLSAQLTLSIVKCQSVNSSAVSQSVYNQLLFSLSAPGGVCQLISNADCLLGYSRHAVTVHCMTCLVQATQPVQNHDIANIPWRMSRNVHSAACKCLTFELGHKMTSDQTSHGRCNSNAVAWLCLYSLSTCLALATAAVFAENAPLYSQIHLSSISTQINIHDNHNINPSHTPSYCKNVTQISYLSKHHRTQGSRQFDFWLQGCFTNFALPKIKPASMMLQ